MRILIDDGMASHGRASGIGHYAVNLASHLAELADCTIAGYRTLRYVPRYLRKWAYIGTTNIAKFYDQYDLVHHLVNYVPFRKGRPTHVLTVHDLSVLLYPRTIPFAWRHYNSVSFSRSVHRADALIAVSRTIHDEILDTFPNLDEKRVYFCYPGIRRSILDSVLDERELDGLAVKPFSYFLFIGDLTKRKNLGFAVRTFLEAKRRKCIQEVTEFVIVGKRSLGFSEIKLLSALDPSIRVLGYLTDRQIASLYRFSKAFVYPSIYEGFGSPLVEAMSQRIPIIISNIPTSQELNNAHNNQMFSFNLGDQNGLLKVFGELDSSFQLIRDQLNYGDLSAYDYRNVAANHLRIYSTVLS